MVIPNDNRKYFAGP